MIDVKSLRKKRIEEVNETLSALTNSFLRRSFHEAKRNKFGTIATRMGLVSTISVAT